MTFFGFSELYEKIVRLKIRAQDKKIRNRDEELKKGWGQFVTPLCKQMLIFI